VIHDLDQERLGPAYFKFFRNLSIAFSVT
jgi:hypothetical protein